MAVGGEPEEPAAAPAAPPPAAPPAGDGGAAAAAPPQAPPPKPAPPGGPPAGRRPVANVAATSLATYGQGKPPPPAAANTNPYNLSDDALKKKEQFDRERAHTNSAVRAEISTNPRGHGGARDGSTAHSGRAGDIFGAGGSAIRTLSDERESAPSIAEAAAKARWKQLLHGVKGGDVVVVSRLLRDVKDLADSSSPATVRSNAANGGAGGVQPYGSQRRPLHYAALYRQPKVVGVLLAHGADPNATDKQGWSPLHCAALNGCVEVARLLLAASAAPHARVFVQANAEQGEAAAAFARRHRQFTVADVIERHAEYAASLLAAQRLAWASCFHSRLGADSPIPASLAQAQPGPHRATSPGGVLADAQQETVTARVARPFASMQDAAGAVIWQPAPAQPVLLRWWKENHPESRPGAKELPWSCLGEDDGGAE